MLVAQHAVAERTISRELVAHTFMYMAACWSVGLLSQPGMGVRGQ